MVGVDQAGCYQVATRVYDFVSGLGQLVGRANGRYQVSADKDRCVAQLARLQGVGMVEGSDTAGVADQQGSRFGMAVVQAGLLWTCVFMVAVLSNCIGGIWCGTAQSGQGTSPCPPPILSRALTSSRGLFWNISITPLLYARCLCTIRRPGCPRRPLLNPERRNGRRVKRGGQGTCRVGACRGAALGAVCQALCDFERRRNHGHDPGA